MGFKRVQTELDFTLFFIYFLSLRALRMLTTTYMLGDSAERQYYWIKGVWIQIGVSYDDGGGVDCRSTSCYSSWPSQQSHQQFIMDVSQITHPTHYIDLIITVTNVSPPTMGVSQSTHPIVFSLIPVQQLSFGPKMVKMCGFFFFYRAFCEGIIYASKYYINNYYSDRKI